MLFTMIRNPFVDFLKTREASSAVRRKMESFSLEMSVICFV